MRPYGNGSRIKVILITLPVRASFCFFLAYKLGKFLSQVFLRKFVNNRSPTGPFCMKFGTPVLFGPTVKLHKSNLVKLAKLYKI